MNRLWDIPELVRLIFEFLDKTTRIRLAPVCRTFWMHNLPFTWERVGLPPLLKLLPDDAVSWMQMGERKVRKERRSLSPRGIQVQYSWIASRFKAMTVTLTRALRNCDWDRFILYSQHVKRFVVGLGESTRHIHQQLLPHLPLTPILPNLTSVELEIEEEMEPNLRLLGFFLPSSLREVGVWADSGTFMAEPGYRWMVDGLAEIVLPELTSLSIVTKQSSQRINHSICQVLLSHLGIETLRMETGPGQQYLKVLRAAGQLPLLRRFEMENTRLIMWPEVDVKESEIIYSPPGELVPSRRVTQALWHTRFPGCCPEPSVIYERPERTACSRISTPLPRA